MTLQSRTSVTPSFSTQARGAVAWDSGYGLASSLDFEPSTWVKLFHPPTDLSFDEAWLLCQCSDDQWLAWIPDHGEILLNTRDFCSL